MHRPRRLRRALSSLVAVCGAALTASGFGLFLEAAASRAHPQAFEGLTLSVTGTEWVEPSAAATRTRRFVARVRFVSEGDGDRRVDASELRLRDDEGGGVLAPAEDEVERATVAKGSSHVLAVHFDVPEGSGPLVLEWARGEKAARLASTRLPVPDAPAPERSEPSR